MANKGPARREEERKYEAALVNHFSVLKSKVEWFPYLGVKVIDMSWVPVLDR